MYPKNDTDFEDIILRNVKPLDGKGFELERNDGWLFQIETYGATPKAGDIARFYGKGIGYNVRGLFINGWRVFYRTAEEEQARWDRERAEEITKKQNEARLCALETGTRISKLPDVFQRRLEKFRDTNPNFDWEFLPYELMCCEEAMRIVTWAQHPTQLATPFENVKRFVALTYEEQKSAIPDMEEGHSGNSMSFSIRLAYLFLGEDPEEVVREHGALVPLVGCQKYGCPHPEA